MPEKQQPATVYDDVHRTLEARCRRWLIPLTNEIFTENYTNEDEVMLGRNEHMGSQNTQELKKRITDSYFTIRENLPQNRYHLENQSTPDKTILKRIFEYDAMLAVETSEETKKGLEAALPKAAVIYLRNSKSAANQMQIELHTPGGMMTYSVPVIKVSDYTIDELFEKQLFFLIPFHIFVYENQFMMYNENAEELNHLQKIYMDIFERLLHLVDDGVLTSYEYTVLRDMSMLVIEQLAGKYEKIVERFRNNMGGKIIETPSSRIFDAGVAQGMNNGIHAMLQLVKKGIITLTMAAQELNLTEDELRKYM